MKKIFAVLLLACFCWLFYSNFFSTTDSSSSSHATENTITESERSRSSSISIAQTTLRGKWNAVNLTRHWEKHQKEFPEYRNEKEYEEAALLFFRSPPSGTKQKKRINGDRLYYHPPSNTFGVTTKDGIPKTFFRPDNGERYWRKQ